MTILLVIAGVALCAGIILLIIYFIQNKNLGALRNNIIYKDSKQIPGQVLFAKSIMLCGKPDYLIRDDNVIYPVEIKSGRTPKEPFMNHTMQLMAYCLLVEENYGIRPPGGFLKYPHKEFKIAYTDEAKNALREVVGELLLLKHSHRELHCSHPEHN